MKKEKTLTKRERKALNGPGPSGKSGGAGGDQGHIHCIACGRHIDPTEFDAPASATYVRCQHGSKFSSCAGCVAKTTAILAEHDRTGQPPKSAEAWH